MRRNVTMVLAWVAATLVALGAASAAVRVVADQVATDLPPPLPGDLRPTGDVIVAAPSPDPTPSATEQPSASPSVVAGVPPSPTSPQPVVPASPTIPSPSATPTPDPPPPATSETRTVHVVGGSTALRFESGTVTVVWATPNAGFTVTVEGSGTAEAKVRFRSDGHRSEVKGSYEDGRVDVEVEEDDDHSGSGGDDGSDDD